MVRLWSILLITFAIPVLQAQSVEEYSRQTRRLINDYLYGEALSVVERGLEQFPDHPRLLLYHGDLLIRFGKLNRAERILERVSRAYPGSGEFLLEAAQLYLKAGRIAPAVSLFQRILQFEPGHPRVHHRLGLSYFFLNRMEDAQRHARLAADHANTRSEYQRFYALLLELSGNSTASYRQLQKARQLSPDDAKLAFQLSDRALQQGKLRHALEYLEVAVRLDSENPLYHSKLSSVYAKLGFEQEAKRETSKAIRLEQAFERYSEALQLTRRGRTEEASLLLTTEVEANPEFLTGRLLLGRLLQNLGKSEQAIEVYQQILKSESTLQIVVEESAWLQLQQGSVKQAIELLSRAGQTSPNSLLWRAYANLLEEDWQEAVDKLLQVEQDYPLNPSLLQLISFCYRSLGKFQQALSYLEKAHHLDPGNNEIEDQARRVRFDYVIELEKSGEWEKALPVLDSLVAEKKSHPEFLFHRAFSHQQLGQFESAVEDFRRGLHFDSQAAWARANLAFCLYSLRRFDEAAAIWEKLAEDNETPEHVYHLGLARMRQNRVEEGWKLVGRSAAQGYPPALQLLEAGAGPATPDP